ncbi:hypothetical protein HK098_006837 [Nowakowskiella sp. JEL0407]|nr:hypothetical protein HK098_006837 [Nowakowskiella sp. JEL0407]
MVALPSLKLYPDSATYFSDADQSSANITVLKNKITSQIYNTIFSHFHQGAYHHTIANILWEKRILHQYATNPYFRVDATGKMFLEPELIYSVLVDLATSVSPADTSTIPDPFLSNLISSCVSGIMTHLSPLETPNNSGAMFKFAVTRIVKESVVVLLKLRRCDARYTVFLPKEGDPFDSLRMSTINHGNVVAFSWGVGWEKKKDDGEDVVKILAQVWVK